MITERGIQKIALLTIMLSLVIVSAAAAGTDDEHRAAAALFNRYETIFYTNTDLSTPLTPYKGLSRPAATSLTIPFGNLPAGLDLLNKHASSEILGSADAVLMGARDFIPPRGAGDAGHPGLFSFIVVFGKQSIPTIRDYFPQTPAASETPVPIWKWVADLYEREPPVTYYAAQVGRSYLVFSNDLGELQKIAAELTSSGDVSKSLTAVPDWSFVSGHEYWGYRFIRRKGSVEKDVAALDQFMPGAESIMFWVDVKQKAGLLRLLGSQGTKRAVANINQQFAAEPSGTPMSFQPDGAGVWDAPFSLSGGQIAMGRIWEIMSYFGFTILI
jgi:hypothetical protein